MSLEQAQGTSTTGNTKTSCVKEKNKKRRNYMVTFWISNYPRELPKRVKYMVTCEDSTKDGKYHGHAFIYFNNPCTMGAVKKLFGNDCHVEVPRKNSDAIGYILDSSKRKHDWQEFGERPMDNGIHATVGELKKIDNPDELPWQCYNTWKKIKDETHAINIMDWYKPDIKVTYIYGPSGSNKTYTVYHQILRDNGTEVLIDEVKHVGDFWTGVSGEADIAVYDDFRDSHMKASEFINFIDYYMHNLNVKGGSIKNRYKHIYITSVQSPREIYSGMGDEPKAQWLRRMKIISFANDGYAEASRDDV